MRPLRLAALSIVFFWVASTMLVFAQAGSEDNDGVPKIHRFQPLVPAKTSSSQQKADSTAGDISAAVADQINALEQEKVARTAVQRKISSRILYTARMLQGQPPAQGAPSLFTNLELDEQNNLFVDIRAVVSQELLNRLRSMGVKIVHADFQHRNIRAFVSPSYIEAVASLSEVSFIAPRSEARTVGSSVKLKGFLNRRLSSGFPRGDDLRERVTAQLTAKIPGIACTGQGSVTSEGYTTHRADAACATFGATGAGVKIGVLSNGVSSLAISQASGDLPADVTVLPGQVGSGDEGTAMLEIIHDLAPDAKLYFATAFTSIESFAQNIRDLRAAGCDIIVDDVFYFVESPFQDGQAASVLSDFDGGVVTQAANDVTADGAMYFSSAGNNGNKDDASSGTFEGDFVDGGSNSHLPGGKVAKFGTTGYNVIASSQGGPILLHWSDPLGGSGNDYDLFLTDSTGNTLLDASTDVQDGSQDPIEGVGTDDLGDRIIVFKPTAAAARFLHLEAIDANLQTSTAGQVHGHAGASGAFAVAATPADLPFCNPPACPTGPFPNPFGSSNVVEPFSSDGPRRIFFEADGSPITPGNFSSSGGAVLQKPQFTAADGVSVTGVNFFTPFYGTSAAAPHAAAIAALAKSVDTSASNSEIAGFLNSSAIGIMGTGVDRDSGAGIIMAFGAVQAATTPSIISLSAVSGNVGDTIIITGKRFGGTQGTSTVTFNGTSSVPTIWGDTSISVKVPVGVTNGNVVVTVAGLPSNGIVFTLTPSITSLSSNLAPAGTSVTITGTNFGSTQASSTVKFNGIKGTVTVWGMTSIAVNVPLGATGNVVVAVNSIGSNGVAFTLEDYGFQSPLTDITVTAGQSQAENFTVTTGTGFDAAITFACSGLPSKSSCTFTPSTVTPGANPTTDVAMNVTTTATVNGSSAPMVFGIWLPFGGLGLVFGLTLRKNDRKRKILRGVLSVLGMLLILAIVSCGGGGSHVQPVPGTQPGTYNITMRATSGPTSHSETFNLIVH